MCTVNGTNTNSVLVLFNLKTSDRIKTKNLINIIFCIVSAEHVASSFDFLKIYQLTILKRLPSEVRDKLEAMTDIQPLVLQDVAIIAEKFPCNIDNPGKLCKVTETAVAN